MVVNHDVEPVNAVAGIAARRILFDCAIDVWLHWDECFDDHVLESFLHLFIVNSLAFVFFPKHVEVPLRSLWVIIWIIAATFYEAPISLVWAVVGEVHEHLVACPGVTRVLLRSKANEALLVDVYFEWGITRHKHIHSEVVLVTIYQVRIIHILAN